MFSQSSLVQSQANATFMSRVYFWMMLGLAISGMVAYSVAGSPSLVASLYSNKVLLIGAFVLQIGAVVALTAMINRMSFVLTTTLYMAYAALSGVTFSFIFLAFTSTSIASTFFITSFAFVGLSVYGTVTKRDLTALGSFCMTGLFGLIGFMLVAMLFPSIRTSAVSMTINVLGLLIFAGLTAYDTQKIKSSYVGDPSSIDSKKAAIVGALTLYLDFINLFLNMLQLFGERR